MADLRDLLHTLCADATLSGLLRVYRGFLHQSKTHYQPLFLDRPLHSEPFLSLGADMEIDVSHTFVEKEHSPGISASPVSDNFGTRAVILTRTSTFLLTLRFECALTIFLTAARG